MNQESGSRYMKNLRLDGCVFRAGSGAKLLSAVTVQEIGSRATATLNKVKRSSKT